MATPDKHWWVLPIPALVTMSLWRGHMDEKDTLGLLDDFPVMPAGGSTTVLPLSTPPANSRLAPTGLPLKRGAPEAESHPSPALCTMLSRVPTTDVIHGPPPGFCRWLTSDIFPSKHKRKNKQARCVHRGRRI